MDTPAGPIVSTNQSNYLSVEALPYIIGENNQVIGFDKYYDKELEKSLYKLTTEGTIYFKISAREPGRTSAGNIKLFEDRLMITKVGHTVVIPDYAFFKRLFDKTV